MFHLCELQPRGETKHCAGKYFAEKDLSEEEMGLNTGSFSELAFVAHTGGQLFTKQQVHDFAREMEEWIRAPTLDGGAGVSESEHKMVAAAEKDEEMTEYQRGINEYKQVLVSAFINRQSSRGDTALHQAVKYKRTPTIDWLLNPSLAGDYRVALALPSMSILNVDHLTAFTLAARHGDVEIMKHLLIGYQKHIVWKMGSVSLTRIDLEQIDTFRIVSQTFVVVDVELRFSHEVFTEAVKGKFKTGVAAAAKAGGKCKITESNVIITNIQVPAGAPGTRRCSSAAAGIKVDVSILMPNLQAGNLLVQSGALSKEAINKELNKLQEERDAVTSVSSPVLSDRERVSDRERIRLPVPRLSLECRELLKARSRTHTPRAQVPESAGPGRRVGVDKVLDAIMRVLRGHHALVSRAAAAGPNLEAEGLEVDGAERSNRQGEDKAQAEERKKAMKNFFDTLAEVAQGRFEHRTLHQNPKYISALELVVRHNKDEFITELEDLPDLHENLTDINVLLTPPASEGGEKKEGGCEVSTQRNITLFEQMQ